MPSEERGAGKFAYPATLAELGDQVRSASVDHEAFTRPMGVCDLSRCRAACCHDGVVLGNEEAQGIRRVVAEHPDLLEQIGWVPPGGDEILVTEEGKLRTATRPAEPGELADDFPAHFLPTRCVFLDTEHRCVLQRLAAETGRHPWFWKPVSCWMHPILLKPGRNGDPPVLTVLSANEDPERFATCTHCGRPEPGGDPASTVLQPELQLLGELAGRNLLGELQ